MMPRTPPKRCLLRLPLMLRTPNHPSMAGCSKAAQGLSVQAQEDRIFTVMSISPSLSLRQCPNHYAFRAGLNLPDKEFRYLRTVIVTAAVHQGFSSEREPASLTVWHWAGVSSHTLSYDFAETYVFDKQLLGPLYCDLMFQRYPFFRSYGVILPSSLKRVSSRFFVFSTTPPVSVYGTGLHVRNRQDFLGTGLQFVPCD